VNGTVDNDFVSFFNIESQTFFGAEALIGFLSL
jgi:hypothetical protein